MPAKPKSTGARSPVSRAANSRLVGLLSELARGEGFIPSRLPGVKFMRSTEHIPRTPVVYDQSIVIIAQGRKTGHLGGRTFIYDANNYLVLAMPMPFECETEGTTEEPMLGVAVSVTPGVVAELLMTMESSPSTHDVRPQVIQAAPLDRTLSNATVRLLECLRSADDARILGPQIVREITYRVLLGKLGGNLPVRRK